MRNGKWIAVSLATLLGASVLVIADDAMSPPTTEPATQPTKMKHERGLVHPWNQLTDLTTDQKEKIEEIHSKTIQQRQLLERQERSEVMAILTPDQQKTIEDIEGKIREAHREAERARKENSDATTQPMNEQ